MMGQKVRIGVGQQVDRTDFHGEAIDLLSNHDFFEPKSWFSFLPFPSTWYSRAKT
jgi:hypothetical protein